MKMKMREPTTVQLYNNCSFDIAVKSSKNTHIEKLHRYQTISHIFTQFIKSVALHWQQCH